MNDAEYSASFIEQKGQAFALELCHDAFADGT